METEQGGLPASPWLLFLRDAVTFQTPPLPPPKLIGMPLAYKHLELLRLRSGLELGEFITVKSVEAGGGVCGGGGSGISKD